MSTDTGTQAAAMVRDTVVLAAARVLGLEQVGADRNFFELGGSSLSVALLTEELEGMLGVECPMQLLYEHPVLADFAQVLSGSHASRSTS